MPGSNNLDRLAGTHLLAIATTAQSSHDEELIPREPMEARNKLVAEATPEEIKLILGWMMDFRSLIISLPNNKHMVWSRSIQELLVTGSAKAKELETLIGRLGHLGMVLPFVYHFLSRLREWHHKSKNKRHPHEHAHGVPT
jgi:hypothetical protein